MLDLKIYNIVDKFWNEQYRILYSSSCFLLQTSWKRNLILGVKLKNTFDFILIIQARVKPKCGRFVAFRSNQLENLHGVLGVTSGVRCALPVWFTLSDHPSHVESDRVNADTELMRMKIIAAREAKKHEL